MFQPKRSWLVQLAIVPLALALCFALVEGLQLVFLSIESIIICILGIALYQARRLPSAGSAVETNLSLSTLASPPLLLDSDSTRSAALSEANQVLQQQVLEQTQSVQGLRNDAERLTAIIDTQQDIATAELDLNRVMAIIVERTQKLTHACGAAIALVDGDEMVYRVASGIASPLTESRVKVADSLVGQSFRTNQSLYCPEVETDSRVNQSLCQKIGLRSMIVVPLRYERKVTGVLQVLSRHSHTFQPQDTHTLQLMAGFIAAAMIHAAEFSARRAMLTEYTTALTALRESQQRFKNAFDASAIGMVLIGLDGQLSQVNSALCEMLGYSRQDLEALNIQTITYHEDQDADLLPLCRMLAGELTKYQTEKRCIHQQGHLIWTHLSVALVRNSQDEPLHLIAQIQDITERRRAQAERDRLLQEQAARVVAEAAEHRSAFLAEASKVLASSLDYEVTLASVARLAVSQLADCCVIDMVDDDRYSIRQLTFAHVDPAKEQLAEQIQQCHPLKMNQLRPVLRALRTGEPELIQEVPLSLLEGSPEDEEHRKILRALKPKSVMIVPLLTAGRTLGAISFMTTSDSERSYTETDLALATELGQRAALAVDNARLYREAQELNRLKDDFLATLSHELRTPMNSLLGWAKLLRHRKFNQATTARALEIMERNAQSQAQLVEDILDISRMIQGKLRLQLRPVKLPLVIEAAIAAIQSAATGKNIHLQVQLDSQVELMLGDPDRLQQVVWNLLSNAVKFTPEDGTIQVQLTRVSHSHPDNLATLTNPDASTCSTTPHIELCISDTGQGINPDFLPFVFDRFRQADSSISRHHGGLGLGLAIVRHLVELHGGTVLVKSPGFGQGATFIVDLPLLPVDATDSEPSVQEEPALNQPLSQLEALQLLEDDYSS